MHFPALVYLHMYTTHILIFGNNPEIIHYNSYHLAQLLRPFMSCWPLIQKGSAAVTWHDSWLRAVLWVLLLALCWNAENLGVHNLDPEQRNQAFASSYCYLRLGFQCFQALGDLVLTAVVPPPRLAFRQTAVRVPRQW